MGVFGFLSKFLRSKDELKTIACPYCLRENALSEDKCGGCLSEISKDYKRHYSRDRLLAVPIIGNASAGKTIFVDSLACTLLELCKKQFWSADITPGDKSTEAWIPQVKGDRARRSDDSLPLPTGENNYKRILFVKGIPLWGDRIFTIRDVAGENFQDFTFSEDVKEYVIQSNCAILMIDVQEILGNPIADFHTLFERYVRTLVECGKSPRDRKIIIVLSKADLYRERLPKNIKDYLDNDPLYHCTDGGNNPYYMDLADTSVLNNHAKVTLPMIDQQLSRWVVSLGGSQLISKAKNEGVEIRFTIVSGWGANPDYKTDVHPLRILDPLIWLLEFHSREV